ncbi:MAG TPA: type I-E CRISPR-associated endoribonuclease Cas2 [Spirochaetes bacterium]|nr:type I-E CRISPR-associated endoribonuclease Cas2 [Spirochaetota bacterium]
MTVLILEKASKSLRGELSRWLIQIKVGVYVGKISGRLREKILSYKTAQNATMVYSSNTDQGFKVWHTGETKMEIVDMDGFILTKIKKP